ncbi:unnamed protein product [Caenorhabditis auriculariae]|uniref:Uncharacterized protein n=1 Tax=Caenorhabditis auriculariae TaxID=2777116 RepID=A0A8S1HEV7_9PELO|nr:unnamed protein product [Caenorhabditis auriculariae]
MTWTVQSRTRLIEPLQTRPKRRSCKPGHLDQLHTFSPAGPYHFCGTINARNKAIAMGTAVNDSDATSFEMRQEISAF